MTTLPSLRAPTSDGSILAVPPLDQVEPLLEENRRLIDVSRLNFLGRGLGEFRAGVRAEILQRSREYLSQRGEPVPPVAKSDLFFLAGHQPELFHPGVWIKNFALAGLARKHRGPAINLIVDTDTLKSPTLHLPVPGEPWPKLKFLPFDRMKGEIPWEERRVLDPHLFAAFGSEVEEELRPWGYTPLIHTVWPTIVDQVCGAKRGTLSEAFTSARRTLERRWGCHNLEIPMAEVCRTEGFACFVGAIMAELPRFVTAYNEVVQTHRRAHRIRSRNHPVPDLAIQGSWLETPLWGWRTGQRRGRLFAQLLPDRLQLRCGDESWPELPLPADSTKFFQAWKELETDGYKIRSRALLTTLFARLGVADLFLHGIGGGKYDELTDNIAQHFWGMRPPGYLVMSATRWLPLPGYSATKEQARQLAYQLRDMNFNPQRHLTQAESEAIADLLEQRRRFPAEKYYSRREMQQRNRAIKEANRAIGAALDAKRNQVHEELLRVRAELAGGAILRRRDYSFVLYPEETLRDFLVSAM